MESRSQQIGRVEVQGAQSQGALMSMLIAGGKSPLEARLLADGNTSVTVTVENIANDTSVLKAIQATASRAGLMNWTTGINLHLVGTVSAWRILLLRWPIAAGESWGRALSGALHIPLRVAKPMQWPSGAPEGWGERPTIMGILNMTPDSFSDAGQYFSLSKAVERALSMVEQGADMLDIGGESTRPGAEPVSVEDEIARVVPVIREIARHTRTPISIDTFKPEVAAAALDAGGAVINDITGLSDARMKTLAVKSGVPVIVMHMQGVPRTMQQDPQYIDVVADVYKWLADVCERAEQAGVRAEQIITDPGIGFGKATEHNLALMARLGDFQCLGYPVLIGPSRKSMIGNVLGLPVNERLEGTAATVALSVYHKADIIRVHDVKEMRRVADMAFAMITAR